MLLLLALACGAKPEDVIVTKEELSGAVLNPSYDKTQIATLDPTPTTAFTHADLQAIGTSSTPALIALHNAIKSSDGTNEHALTGTPVAGKLWSYVPENQRHNLLAPVEEPDRDVDFVPLP